jgi:hypothetical protein
MARTQPEAAARAAAASRHRVRAFGLEIDASFPAPGLPPAEGDPIGPAVRVDLVPEAEIDRDWPAAAAQRVLEERFDDDGDPARTIDVHPEAGYRLYARHFGLARISADGAEVVCAPPGPAEWDWQRFLVGRILPWAAVLNGYEPLHAGAVALGGCAVAFVGPTGAGKTSLALRLVAGGAEFLTDDVLALDTVDDELRAHPGAAIASVREAERKAIAADVWGTLGTVLGDSGKTYLEVPRVSGPRPLGAIYFLRTGDAPAIEALGPPDPRLLLASTFVLGVQTPERLRNQLDICARIARDVPAFGLCVTAGLDSAGLAAAVSEHLASLGRGA